MKKKSVNRNYLNPSLLVETENNKYVLSEPVSKKQMYHLMLNLLEQDYFREEQLTSSEVTRNYLNLRLSHYEQEVFGCLYLDSQHRVMCFEELFYGTIDSAVVYPREVVKRCLVNNASAIILTHNHPSGDCTPSQADKLITKRLQDALEPVDIRVLDHIVVAGIQTLSFAERGLL